MKQKRVSTFFGRYLISTLNFEYFATKITLMRSVFSKLETAKDVVS